MAKLRLVHDVVVVEGGDVGQLDGDGPVDEPGVGAVAEVTRQQHQHGPEPLPAGRQDVGRGFAEQLVVGPDGLLQLGLDLIQARPDLRFQDRIRCFEPPGGASRHLVPSFTGPMLLDIRT